MSKERAQRRAERERAAADQAAARQRAAGRRKRAEARRHAVTGWIPRPHLMPGALAARRRAELMAAAGLLLVLNVLVWIVRPDWAARVGAVVVSIVVFPVVLLAVRKP